MNEKMEGMQLVEMMHSRKQTRRESFRELASPTTDLGASFKELATARTELNLLAVRESRQRDQDFQLLQQYYTTHRLQHHSTHVLLHSTMRTMSMLMEDPISFPPRPLPLFDQLVSKTLAVAPSLPFRKPWKRRCSLRPTDHLRCFLVSARRPRHITNCYRFICVSRRMGNCYRLRNWPTVSLATKAPL